MTIANIVNERPELRELINRIIFETSAYRVDTGNPFVYTSRKIGADYIDMGMIQNSPKGWMTMTKYFCEMVKYVLGKKRLDKITGGEIRDLVFSIPVAMKLKVPHVIIRKEEKTYGAKGKFVGDIQVGDYVVHIADLMTVGTSSHLWISAIREEAKAVIEYYFEGFDRLQDGGESLLKLDPPVHNFSLAQRDSNFYDVGTRLGYIKDREELDKYISNPEKWAKAFLLNNPDFIYKHLRIVHGHIDQKRKQGLEILTRGYPELLPKLGPAVYDFLKKKKVTDSVIEIGYRI